MVAERGKPLGGKEHEAKLLSSFSHALAARPEEINANSFKQELPEFAIISAAAETNSIIAGLFPAIHAFVLADATRRGCPRQASAITESMEPRK
jgi:hypothetical protein